MADLDRFKQAQDSPHGGLETALRELRSGAKRSHWIWYVFPQLLGLGESPASQHYSIRGLAEATDYLRDGELRARLLAATQIVVEQLRRPDAPPLVRLMGSRLDTYKLVSSLTLFARAAAKLREQGEGAACQPLEAAAGEVLEAAKRQGFPPCERTLHLLQIARDRSRTFRP